MESALVKINVGGRLFEVSEDVLRSRGENMITRLLFHTNEKGMKKKVDKEGNLFIDGDSDAFAAILDFLRLGKLHIPFSMSWSSMQDELDYYCIDISQRRQDTSLCSRKVQQELIAAAEDPNFGVKLKEYAAQSYERFAKKWLLEHKKSLVSNMVEAANRRIASIGESRAASPANHESSCVFGH